MFLLPSIHGGRFCADHVVAGFRVITEAQKFSNRPAGTYLLRTTYQRLLRGLETTNKAMIKTIRKQDPAQLKSAAGKNSTAVERNSIAYLVCGQAHQQPQVYGEAIAPETHRPALMHNQRELS